MSELENYHHDMFTLFRNGHHVERRSNRLWAGLFSDLIIEQAIIRSLKVTGGLTRGRGMSERQRPVWLFSMMACIKINAMQEFCSLNYTSSNQDKTDSQSRTIRDSQDKAK